jgi:hypothetical protein
MKLFKFYLSAFLLLFISCASTQEVIFDYNKNVDFNQYSTFVLCVDDLFVEYTNQPNYDNKTVRNYLAEAVEYEMKKRNHRTNVLNPELQVGFTITISENTVSFVNCEEENTLDYWKECKIQERTYLEETLITYVSDYKTNEIIWQASIDCSLNKPKKLLKEHIDELVKQLFNTYPKTVKALF